MRARILIGVPLLLAGLMPLVGCSRSAFNNTAKPNCSSVSTVYLEATNFSVACTNVKSGTSVQFVEAHGSPQHILCLGTNQQCSSNASGPQQLRAPGLTVGPGQSQSVTFSSPGTYQVTDKYFPQMNFTVNVTG